MGEGGGGDGDPGFCNLTFTFTIQCDKIEVNLKRFQPSPWPTNQWDFGDGSPILTGGPELNPVNHIYTDVNPYLKPIIARHRLDDNSEWCEEAIEFPGVFVGSGCGSTRKVSQLVADGIFPPNGMTGIKLYIFGNLEVDISYQLDNCDVFVSSGGKIILTQNCILLDVVNNTIMDAHTVGGALDCDQTLWHGIEMQPGSALETNGATIRNAYFAISSSHGPWGLPLPRMVGLISSTFERNFIDIYAVEGQLAINKFVNNTFAGAYDQEIYQIGTCGAAPPTVPGVPFARRTYCGIYFDGAFDFWGNAHLSLPANSFGNVFKDKQAGIVALNGTANIRGCRFENIRRLPNNAAAHQATAITFIDNLAGSVHRLIVAGLGKTSTATIHNVERGIYALTSQPMTQVSVANCRMTEVQNGILLGEGMQGAMGNFNDVDIRNNYIGCTRYFNTIQSTSTGIDINDPNTVYSNIEILNNEVNVDQPEGFVPIYNPALGLTGIQVTAMTPQAPNALMALQIGGNTVEMPNGLNGIRTNSVSNAVIYNNVVTNAHLEENNISSIQIYGIKTTGGINNSLECNQVLQEPSLPTPPYFGYGLYIEGSVNAMVEGNKIEGLAISITFIGDNGTGCVVSSNELNAQSTGAWGLFYENTLTGPQYLEANEWVNTFLWRGAIYEYDPALPVGYTHCQSLYHVSPAANVGGSSANIVEVIDQPSGNICNNDWFTVLSTNEYASVCGASSANRSTEINEADTDLAGGGTSNLTPGFKWSTEINLYRKFTENPAATAQEPIAAAFQQSRTTQAVGSMYRVRKGMDLSSAVTASLAEEIFNLTAQIKTSDSLLQAFSGGLPGNLVAWANLQHQTDSLAVLWASLQDQAIGQINAKAVQVSSDNGAVVCNDQPCTLERYLNDLYLQTRVLAPRPLTQVEVATVGDIAVQCPQDAGPVVYLARSWYYLLTGEMLADACAQLPDLDEVQQRSQAKEGRLNTVSISPNPADESAVINTSSLPTAAILLVTDAWGQSRTQLNIPLGESSVLLATAQLPSGCYVATLLDTSGKPLAASRFVVLH